MYMNITSSEAQPIDHLPNPDRFSNLLRTHRERLGMSCEEMSLCAGLAVDTWASLESCEIPDRSFSVLSLVASAIDVDLQIVLALFALSQRARHLGWK